jgi:hypothetical protein
MEKENMYFNDITKLLDSDYTNHLTWCEIQYDFTLPLSYNDDTSYDGWQGVRGKVMSDKIGLIKSDIIGFGSMHYIDTYRQTKTTNLCFYKGKLYPVGLTKEFFEINSILFKDITAQIIRDKKLNKILN